MDSEKITIRLPRIVVDEMRQLAVEHNRSMTGEITNALRRYVASNNRSRTRKDNDDEHSDGSAD